jgi:FdhD protein
MDSEIASPCGLAMTETLQVGVRMISPQKAIHYERYEFKKWSPHDAETIVETPVSLTVNGEVWLTFMCTPVNLEEMSVGFLYNDGFLERMVEVDDVRVSRRVITWMSG